MATPGRATMRDVAALAGVSQKTVSRVINAEPAVSDELQLRVQRAIEQLGYRHNLAASALRSGQRTRSIALLVQDLSNDFSAAVLRAVEDETRAHGVVVLSASLDEEEARERELVGNLIARRVDGLIMMPASDSQAYLHADVAAGFGVVMIDREPRHLPADAVLADHVGGARDATAHLIAHGHRRIALIADDPRIATARQRHTGYEAALAEAGIPLDSKLSRTARTQQEAEAAVGELLALDEPPTAVFAARNTLTMGVVAALRARGLQHAIGLVGFDELRMADLLEPGVTTVDQHPSQIGAQAARLLLARLQGSAAEPTTVVLPTTLIPRGSGETRPSRR